MSSPQGLCQQRHIFLTIPLILQALIIPIVRVVNILLFVCLLGYLPLILFERRYPALRRVDLPRLLVIVAQATPSKIPTSLASLHLLPLCNILVLLFIIRGTVVAVLRPQASPAATSFLRMPANPFHAESTRGILLPVSHGFLLSKGFLI